MNNERTKVFLSFYHKDDGGFKKQIEEILGDDVINKSVGDYDIDDEGKSDEEIRKEVRDNFLKDSTVSIVLVGDNTHKRKHVDWEIYSSMYEKKDAGHYKSGILVIDLNDKYWLNNGEMRKRYNLPSGQTATKESTRDGIQHFPKRLITNILKEDVTIRVAKYSEIVSNKEYLLSLIEEAKENKIKNKYDFSEPMRRRNG